MIEALDRFTRRLEAFVARERNFTRDASHELRTPVAVVRACLDLLERDKQRPAADAASLDRIRRAVTQMQSLIESLLLLAREDELHLPDEKTHVNAVVVEQIDLLADFARDTGNVVRVVEKGDLIVAAPPRMIAIVLTNLLRNALTYSHDGVVEVTIGPESVSVSDSGAGMSAEDLQRVFEPFFRGDASQNLRGIGPWTWPRDRAASRRSVRLVAGSRQCAGKRYDGHTAVSPALAPLTARGYETPVPARSRAIPDRSLCRSAAAGCRGGCAAHRCPAHPRPTEPAPDPRG